MTIFFYIFSQSSDEELVQNKRRLTYRKKHSQEEKNPLGLTKMDVMKGIDEGKIVPGDPPPDRGTSSEQYKLGIKFLFFENDDDQEEEKEAEVTKKKKAEVINWFFCEKCAWVHNAVLGGGTGNLLRHAKKHQNPTYTFSKLELSNILATVANYARLPDTHISEKHFQRVLPDADKW